MNTTEEVITILEMEGRKQHPPSEATQKTLRQLIGIADLHKDWRPDQREAVDEARSQVGLKTSPETTREAFDALLVKLRASAPDDEA